MPCKNKIIYIGGGITSPYPRIRISTDGGQTWTPDGRYGGWDPYSDIFAFAFVDSGYVLAGTDDGLYRSKDHGLSWQQIPLPPFDKEHAVMALLVSTNKTIFAGGVDAIYRSTDNGNSWSVAAGPEFVFPYVWSMTITKDGTIFAGQQSWIPRSAKGLIRSTDNGNTWEFVNNFPNLPTTNLEVPLVVAGNDGEVYASPNRGLYVSYDKGNSWERIDEIDNYWGRAGYTSKNLGTFVGFYWQPGDKYTLYRYYNKSWQGVPGVIGGIWGITQWSDNEILVATSEGLYKVGFYEITSVQSTPEVPEFYLLQNYPNPFNPVTTIEFAVPEKGRYKLKVYDILGQEVATLFDDEINAGTQKLTFNGSNLHSGIYIYRLIGKNVNISKKMILMK
ncbi:MAG: T9SS type A sorting domain-containing protein [Melioribacter sp.]|nr:T9SS type A sorting domain-containing protein [Melioribacter sp.]